MTKSERWYERRGFVARHAQEISDRIAAGEHASDIAKEFGVSRQRISQILRRDGLPTRPTKPPMLRPCSVCPDNYEAGAYLAHVEAAGHQRFPPALARRPEWAMYDEQIVEMYQRGERLAYISVACDRLAYPTIYRILRRNGIEPSRGSGKYPRDERWLRAKRVRRALRERGVELQTVSGWRAP